MGTNAFLDKAVKPDDEKLAKALGGTYKYWIEIKQFLNSNYPGTIEEWKNYCKYGWTLKTLLKKRNLFFFSAYEKYFIVGFIYGDKAVAAVEQSDLPEAVKVELRSAKKYAEGRGIRIEVKKQKDVANIKKLIDIKINN
jgi:hypothetical protein